MDKNTYGQYGWIVIVVIIICILISTMPGIGMLIRTDIKGTLTGFRDITDEALDNIGEKYMPDPDPDRAKPVEGETVEVGDYVYTYHDTFMTPALISMFLYSPVDDIHGWSVVAKENDKTTYGNICEKIYGEPVIYMYETFEDCTLLEKSPAIPKSIMFMRQTFLNCTSLTGNVALPDSTAAMVEIFGGTSKAITASIPMTVSISSQIDCPSTVDNVTYKLSTSKHAYAGENYGSTKSVANGDQVIIGDYLYCYNYAMYGSTWVPGTSLIHKNAEHYDEGWTVMALDKTKSSYGEICSTIYGKPVVNVDMIFLMCENLSALPEFPSTVTSLGSIAFAQTALAEITVPENVVVIDDYVFYECPNLTTVNFPASVTYISPYAFESCDNLSVINFEAASPPDYFFAPDGVTVNCNVSQ